MGIPGIVARQTQVGVEEWEKHMARHKQTHGLHTTQTKFLDALASLDFKLSVSQSLSDSPFSSIKASASTGLSELSLRQSVSDSPFSSIKASASTGSSELFV